MKELIRPESISFLIRLSDQDRRFFENLGLKIAQHLELAHLPKIAGAGLLVCAIPFLGRCLQEFGTSLPNIQLIKDCGWPCLLITYGQERAQMVPQEVDDRAQDLLVSCYGSIQVLKFDLTQVVVHCVGYEGREIEHPRAGLYLEGKTLTFVEMATASHATH